LPYRYAFWIGNSELLRDAWLPPGADHGASWRADPEILEKSPHCDGGHSGALGRLIR
jgi:hypothetical protein